MSKWMVTLERVNLIKKSSYEFCCILCQMFEALALVNLREVSVSLEYFLKYPIPFWCAKWIKQALYSMKVGPVHSCLPGQISPSLPPVIHHPCPHLHWSYLADVEPLLDAAVNTCENYSWNRLSPFTEQEQVGTHMMKLNHAAVSYSKGNYILWSLQLQHSVFKYTLIQLIWLG